MALDTHLLNLLSEAAAVAALVGGPVTQTKNPCRIYMVELPQPVVYPCIGIQQVSGYESKTLDGTDGWENSRFQVDCWANNLADAWTLARAVHNAVKNYGGTRDGTKIKTITRVLQQYFKEPAPNKMRIQMDFMIWHCETNL